MTDRLLPNLMPTTDPSLFARTLEQSVLVDSPPPSQAYGTRATTFQALAPLVYSHFYSDGVQRRVAVVFTDGESQPVSPVLPVMLHRQVTPIFVHIWSSGERIFRANGSADPH